MNRRVAIAATVALAIHAVGLPTPAQADAALYRAKAAGRNRSAD